jgi:hypothetical protein
MPHGVLVGDDVEDGTHLEIVERIKAARGRVPCSVSEVNRLSVGVADTDGDALGDVDGPPGGHASNGAGLPDRGTDDELKREVTQREPGAPNVHRRRRDVLDLEAKSLVDAAQPKGQQSHGRHQLMVIAANGLITWFALHTSMTLPRNRIWPWSVVSMCGSS